MSKKSSKEVPNKSVLTPETKKSNYTKFLLIAIVALTAFVFSPILKNQFTNWDDNQYVYENNNLYPSVQNFKHSLTAELMGNWHPATVWSYMLDTAISGDITNPYMYHLSSLLYHLFNVLLVFLFVRMLTKKNDTIALVSALLFAIHPLHVESVAWVSGRKDVVYAMFFLLGLIAYLKFTATKAIKWYVIAVLTFVLALMAKPAAVVFPLIIVLIDYYQNQRIDKQQWLNKIPFLILSLLSGYITIKFQSMASAIDETSYSFGQKITAASYGFVTYIARFIYPHDYAAFHPFPKIDFPPLYAVMPIIALAIVGLSIWLSLKKRFVGFAIGFYAISIALVLQLITVGAAVIAERYTYVPYIGLAFGVGYMVDMAMKKGGIAKPVSITLVILFGLWFSKESYGLCKIWKNSETLWSQTIKVYPNGKRAYQNRGQYYYELKDFQRALADNNMAYNIDSNDLNTILNRSNTFYELRMIPEAVYGFSKLLIARPNDYKALYGRGSSYVFANKDQEALKDLNAAIEQNPTYGLSYGNRAAIYFKNGNYNQAIADYNKVIQYNPENMTSLSNRGACYLKLGQNQTALNDFNSFLSVKNDPQIRYFRSLAYKGLGKKDLALADALQAQKEGFAIPQSYLNELQP